MKPQTPQKKRNRRYGYQTSASGCLTCKKRRIKCDEAKPICGQCAKSMRHCDGPMALQYRFAAPQTSTSFPIGGRKSSPDFQIPAVSGSHEEKRAFDYYLQKVGPMLAGESVKDLEFWLSLVPRWCVSDTVLWAAIISLSRLYQQVRPAPADACGNGRGLPGYKWSLEYHRAIRDYRQRLSSRTADLPCAFLSSILFAMFEFQLWNVDTALMLVRSSVKLSSQIKKWPDNLDVKEGICRLFASLALLVSPTRTFPTTIAGPFNGEKSFRSSFLVMMPQPLDMLRNRLYSLTYQGSKVMDEASHRKPQAVSGDDEILAVQQRILTDLEVWRDTVLAFRLENPCGFSDCVSSLLLIYYRVTYIELSVCLMATETEFDHHLDAFREIVTHGETTICYALAMDAKPPFLFELNPVPPLAFVAWKCRHSGVRRRARDLMTKARGLTGSCNPWIVDLATVVVRIEEHGAEVPHERWDEQISIQEMASRIPEQKRVKSWYASKSQTGGQDHTLLANLIIHPCISELDGAECVRRVMARLDTGQVLEDATTHVGDAMLSNLEGHMTLPGPIPVV
ncbi:hypothetical protein LTR06_004879 [Exophiala xenobiotica]|nr:hypothetical protein LTR06_004879 [Exophiala xenobiotica]